MRPDKFNLLFYLSGLFLFANHIFLPNIEMSSALNSFSALTVLTQKVVWPMVFDGIMGFFLFKIPDLIYRCSTQ